MNSPRSNWTTLLALLIVAALFSLPMIMMVAGSLKTKGQLDVDPHGLVPNPVTLSNYPMALESMPLVTYLINTLILCAGSVAGTTLSCALVAYGISRVQWNGRKWVFATVVATMLLPWHVTMIPQFVLISKLGLYNTYWAIIGPTLLGNAFFIFLLRQFFLSVPEEIFEAARLDGLSDWGIFWRILLPLSKPALVTVALFQFVYTWNDFGGPLLYLSDPQKFPLAYGLERFVSSYGDQTHLLLAAAVLFTIPILILFFFAQKTFIRGISTTGIKG
ncbi:MAG: carbohydrate ABC transporter permease [Planctomycetota bacterium]